MVKRMFQGLQGVLADFRLQLTFPNGDAVPAHGRQFLAFLHVSVAVTLYLVLPKAGVTFGEDIGFAVFVSVPEAAVYENYGSVFA